MKSPSQKSSQHSGKSSSESESSDSEEEEDEEEEEGDDEQDVYSKGVSTVLYLSIYIALLTA